MNAQRQLLPKGDLRKGFFLSTKSSKIITKKLQKSYCKLVSKELQYGYSKGRDPLAVCEIFFFLFLGYRAPGLLLRLELLHSLCSVCRTGDVPLRVQKSSSGSRTSFFACRKPPESSKSMTLRGFGGHFACFSQKDSFKVWRGRGLYSEAECGKVYTINLDGSNMNDFVVECFMLR